MKKLTVLLAGLGIATAAVPGLASAAPYAPFGPAAPVAQRAQFIQMRIDQGIRTGALNRFEASRLQNELRGIQNLEFRYVRTGGGLDMRERADLDRRYDSLSSKVKFEKHDRQHRW